MPDGAETRQVEVRGRRQSDCGVCKVEAGMVVDMEGVGRWEADHITPPPTALLCSEMQLLEWLLPCLAQSIAYVVANHITPF